jgi:multiple sugar transport system ATP-binding protein
MARVSLVDITKRFAGGQAAVAGLSLEIADGEFVVLVGPSGSGKSTALRMIAGLEEMTSGEIWIGDRLVNDLPPRDRDIAMVFQNYALYPQMTVRDNMGFALKLAKLPKSQIELKVREAAVALELEDLLDRKPAQLSGGQRQRVAMGRAIVRQPQAFLMDEPLSNLDAKLRVQTREQIADLQQRLDVTTVYVTHDQTEALTLGDRIAVLRGGRLQQCGSPEELYLRPANLFVAGFIGSPAMNLVSGTVSDGFIELPFARLPVGDRLRRAFEPLAGAREVILGVRPEDLEPADAAGNGTGLRFDALVDSVESTGADLYVHARIQGGLADSEHLERLVDGDGGAVRSRASDGAARLVARLDPVTGARAGDRVTLHADLDRIYAFEAATGRSLAGAQGTESRESVAQRLASTQALRAAG